MKRYVPKEAEEETTSEIEDICGFVDAEGIKGYLVYVGGLRYSVHAVSVNHGAGVPNTSYGDISRNTFPNVKDFIVERGLQSNLNIATIYFFDSQKELHRWLSED